MNAPVYPTADQVAHAIVAACRLTGEDPIMLARGKKGMRARSYAFSALCELFPDAPAARVAVILGVISPAATMFVANARIGRAKSSWMKNWHATVRDAVPASAPTPADIPAFLPRQPVRDCRFIIRHDVSPILMGDPPPERSALAGRAE